METKQSIMQALQTALGAHERGRTTETRLSIFLLLDALWGLLDQLGGSAITEVPAILKDELRAANRMCRFLLPDGVTVIGTGFLVGPDHVLTAAHLLFEPDGTGKGRLIDPSRPTAMLVEFLTFFSGTSLVSVAPPQTVKLHNTQWAVDPLVSGNATDREVVDLDFAILKLEKAVGEEQTGGGEQRLWFPIPNPANVPIIAANSMIRVFEYLDQGTLRTSIGTIKGVNDARTRLLHTASTLDAASGSLIVNDRLKLAGVHVAGTDEESPFANQGLPLLRIAKHLESKGIRTTVSPGIP